MTDGRFSSFELTTLGHATGLGILGFRACALGQEDCCCVVTGFPNALGSDADVALADIMTLTRLIGGEGRRKIGLAALGCTMLTRDEVLIAQAFLAAQALREDALYVALRQLMGRDPSPAIVTIVQRIADTFAGYGLAFDAPGASGFAVGSDSAGAANRRH